MALTELPNLLRAENCCDYVEEIPYAIRVSQLTALERVQLNPEKFPHADQESVAEQLDAITEVLSAWLSPVDVSPKHDELWQH